MTNAKTQTTKNDWIRRILFLLRGAEVWQLRELYYITAGYIRESGRGVPTAGGGGNAGDVRAQ